MSRNSAYVLIVSVLCLVGLGLVMLLSVSAFARENQGDAFFFIRRQAIWLCAGVVACAVAASLDYQRWTPHAKWGLLLSGLLIAACFVPGMGRAIKGAHRWIILGPFNIQPSEIAKLAIIAFLAFWFGQDPSCLKDMKRGLGVALAVILGICALLICQPDLGTVAVILIISFLILFVAGLQLRYIAPIPIAGLGGILALAMLMPERMGRLLAFLNPELHRDGKGYQVWQALIAFGSGGPQGVGLGNSLQKMHYVPEAHTDFIFPIIGEEMGLACTLLVVLCFLIITLCGIFISFHAPDETGILLGVGATSFIALQAGMNMAVVTSLMPAKGVGLPFISYGGSNLVLCLTCLGILINIHRQAYYEEPDPIQALTRMA